MSFRRYESYRESGCQWLGPLPSAWSAPPFWTLFRRAKRIGFPDETLLSVYRDFGVIRKADRDDNFNNASDDLATYQLVEPDDLAINKMKAWQGSLGVSPYRGIVSPAYFVFRPTHRQEARYLHYLLRSPRFAAAFMTISKGIRPNQWDIDPDQLRLLPVPCPPTQDQVAIVAFLDRETAKIDALVAEQQRLIDLLKEKRQAVISHAVTKGLDPAALKDSGVEWLGQVPAHWKVRPLRHLARLESGHTPSRQKPEYWIEEDCVIQWFTLADVGQLRDGRITNVAATANRISELGMANSAARLLPAETVILSRTASVGFSAILDEPMAVSQDFAAWVCGDQLCPEYLLFCLRSMTSEFNRLMMGSTHQTIYMPDIEAFQVPLPPLSEQVEIARHIRAEKTRLELLVSETEHSLALLLERRAALISAAVTGKIDVRNSVAPKAEVA